MTTATLGVTDLDQILEEVAASFIGEVSATDRADSWAAARTWIETWVEISGTWRGEVVLCVLGPSAPAIAAAMLGTTPDQVQLEDSADALCELVNMVGGQVKATLPDGCRLGLPLMRMVRAESAATGEANVVCQADVTWQGHPVRVVVRTLT